MYLRSVVCASLFALVLAGCEDKELANIQQQTEAQLATLVAEGKLTHGAVAVEKAGDDYRVSIADVTLSSTPEMSLHLGDLAYLHQRVDDETVRFSDVEAAPTITLTDNAGKELATATYTLDHAETVWSEPLQLALDMNAAISTMQIERTDGEPPVDVAGITIEGHTIDPSAGRTDQTGILTVASITVPDNQAGTLLMEGISGKSQFSNIDLAAMKAASDAFQAASKTGENLASSIVAMLNSFSQTSGDFVFERIVHSGADADFSMTNMRFGYDLADVDQATGRLNVSFGYDGLTLPPRVAEENPAAPLIAPQTLALNIDFANVPFREAANQLAAIAPSIEQMGADQPEMAGLMLMSALRAAFSEAGTTVRLDGTRIELRDAVITISGGIDVAPDAALGVVGTMDIALYGLDDLAAAAGELPAGPDTDEFQVTLVGLAAMSNRGEEDGVIVDRFLIEAMPEGAVYVNGQQMF